MKWNLILAQMHKQTKEKVTPMQQVSTVSNDHDPDQGELFYSKEEIVAHIPPEPPHYIEKPLLKNNCASPSLKKEEFHHPPDNVSYIKVGPEYRNKELYSLVKLCAGKLCKEFAGTRSKSGRRCRINVLDKTIA